MPAFAALGGMITPALIYFLINNGNGSLSGIGIFTFSYAPVRLRLAVLSQDITWKHIFGAGLLGGVGLTMSISLLAFQNEALVVHAKISILVASLLSGLVGFFYLKSVLHKPGNGRV